MTLSGDALSATLAREPVNLTLQGGPPRRLVQVLIGIFLVVASAVPYLFGPLLAVILVSGLAVALIFRFTLPTVALGWTIALASLGAFGILQGSIAGHDGAFSSAKIFVVEPLLMGLLLPMAYRSKEDVTRLFRALDIALLVTAGLGFLFYVNTVGGLHLPIAPLIDPRFTTVDLSAGTLRTNFQGYNSLVFLAPYGLFRCVVSDGPDSISILRRIMLAVAALSGIILSGRNALYLSTPLGLLYAWLSTRQPRTNRGQASKLGDRVLTFAFVAGLLGLSLSVLGLSPESTMSRTISQATLQDDSGIRLQESRILLEKWLESPVFGHGTGTTIKGYYRDEKSQGSFELTYHTLLVTFGAVGFALLAAWSGWILKRLKYTDRIAQNRNRCISAGFVGALIAAMSNPYFFKIDGIWMAFVPFAVAVASHRSPTARRAL